jgi:glycerol uptake facilitator-like aquaporin
MGVYVAGGVSGAHLNPAVTLAVAVHRDFAWSKVLPYIAAQIAGRLHRGRRHLPDLPRRVRPLRRRDTPGHGRQGHGGIFATYPQDFLRTFPDGLIDQIVGTAFLIALIFALTDQKNLAPEGRLVPIHFGCSSCSSA